MNEYEPETVSPPGDTIADLLQERGWTREKLAKRTGFTCNFVNQLIRGEGRITKEVARRLECLGGNVDFWLARERNYRANLRERSRREFMRAALKSWDEWYWGPEGPPPIG